MTYFVSDLDGTLLDDTKRLPTDFHLVLDALRQQGHRFTFATSRSYVKAQSFLAGLDVHEPLIINNGAFVVDPLTGKALRTRVLDPDVVLSVLDKGTVEGLTPIMLGKPDEERIFLPPQLAPEQQGFVDNRPNDPRLMPVGDLRQHAGDNIFAINFLYTNRRFDQLATILDQCQLAVTTTLSGDADLHDVRSLEVSHVDANKGEALLWLASNSGVPPDEFTVFGDNGNDLPMFKVAGVSYAVSNGTPEIRIAATEVIPSNREGGVVSCLRRFLI